MGNSVVLTQIIPYLLVQKFKTPVRVLWLEGCYFRGATAQYPEFATVCPQAGAFQISSVRDDQRIFLGLKFSIPGFFWVGKFGKYFFGWLHGCIIVHKAGLFFCNL